MTALHLPKSLVAKLVMPGLVPGDPCLNSVPARKAVMAGTSQDKPRHDKEKNDSHSVKYLQELNAIPSILRLAITHSLWYGASKCPRFPRGLRSRSSAG